jgi:hypothetical protein
MKYSFYFPHDFNAHNDPKMVRLEMEGWDLFGLYWAIIEMLHEQGGFLDNDPEAISFALRANKERITKLLNFPGIFEISDGKITCQRVIRNLQDRREKSDKAKESINKRWHKDTDVLPTNYDGNTIKERKGKEIKEKSNTSHTTDDSFLQTIKKNYSHIDIDLEMKKIDGWLILHPERKKTRRFIINWLNRIEKPMAVTHGKSTGSTASQVRL